MLAKHCMRCELAMRRLLDTHAPGTATGQDQRRKVWCTTLGSISGWQRTFLGVSETLDLSVIKIQVAGGFMAKQSYHVQVPGRATRVSSSLQGPPMSHENRRSVSRWLPLNARWILLSGAVARRGPLSSSQVLSCCCTSGSGGYMQLKVGGASA